MISHRVLRASALNQYFSDLFFYPKYVIEWDYTANNWTTEAKFRKILTWYNLLSIVVSGFVWPLANLFVIIVQGIFYPNSVSNDILFFNIIIVTPCALNFGLNFLLIKHRGLLIEYTGLVLEFVAQYQPVNGKEKFGLKGIISDLKQEITKILKTKNGDFLGVTITLAIMMFTYTSYGNGISAFIAQLDCFSTAIRFFWPVDERSGLQHLLLRLFTGALMGIGAMEACRTFRYVFVYLIQIAVINGSLVRTLLEDSKKDLRSAIQKYDRLQTIHNKMLGPAAKLLFVAIHGGQFCAVFNLAGAIIGWKFLTPIAHWVPTFMAALTVFIIMVAVPFGIRPAEESAEMIREWKYRTGVEGGSPLQRKILATFKPIGFPIEGVGIMRAEFKAHFWSVIVLNTTDVILMIMQAFPN